MSTAESSTGSEELTIDSPMPGQLDFRETPKLDSPKPANMFHLGLIAPSDSDSSESLRLLQARLSAVSFSLAVGFFVFAVWFSLGYAFHWIPFGIIWLVAQYAVTIVLLGTWVWLSKTPDLTSQCGRWIELMIFAVPAIYFTGSTARSLIHGIESFGKIAPIAINGWMILIFAHSIFIPNTWRRAAFASILIAFLPLATTFATAWWKPEVAEGLYGDPTPLVEMTLGLIATATVAIIGVRTIHWMRSEANEAKRLGRYHLRQKIGSGGMGEVYLAEHQMLKRPCAIKIIRPERAGDPKTMARFEREVQATAKLSHWNSVYIYDYGNTPDGTLYYVMEYLPGMTLQELVTKAGPLPPARAIYLLKQICAALEEAHGFGLIHRDVKPANLFVSQRGGQYDVAKLLDFGLVKPFQMSAGEDSELTQQGGIAGSPLYMAPEQALGEEAPDPRSDIYSLGAVAYFMLTGKPPFGSGHQLKVLLQHLNEPPKPPSADLPSDLRWKIPTDLDQIVLRCLNKSLDERYSSACELAKALSACDPADEWNAAMANDWWKARCPKLKQAT